MIRIGIVGYGNLGRGVRSALEQNEDMELVGIFTRRDPKDIEEDDVYSVTQAPDHVGRIDVMLLCGGSATDLPVQGPEFAGMFNTVDSYDNHNRIPEYYECMNEVALENGTLSAVSIGWDPGLFSLNRLLAGAVLPRGQDYTFWGPGVSQGHSDAIRRIEGVADAVQYTIPIEEVVDKVRRGEEPEISSTSGHLRECYVVPQDDADVVRIEEEIKSMPNYFDGYETRVHFVTAEELSNEHSGMPHGGFVIRSGRTGCSGENKHIYQFGLNLDSNPEFTASVLVAYARAVHRLSGEGATGARTVFDIPLSYLSPRNGAELRAKLL
ncbi:MAG: diaminopimelate dehydrogenase [Thermoplasmata archaeon]